MSRADMTVNGYISRDPELRYTHSGKPVCSVSVPHTRRKRNGDQWEDDGPTTWYEATFWDEQAERVAAQAVKNTEVTLTGDPVVETYEGNKGTQAKIVLRNPTIALVVPRPPRNGAGGGQKPASRPGAGFGGAGAGQVWNGPQNGAQQDPGWAPAGQAPAGDDYDDETPF